MVYRTLHTYILRELLRIFLLTASALTTLMAFGGTFRPLTRQGIEVSQLMVIMLNLMPAMLAYAIPIAALFAAVLVYWRLSTDNELTACRAGGISFISVVVPAFFLGLFVASIDLVFVNYVVPFYLRQTERSVMRDIGSLIVSQINHQETFEYPGKIVAFADSAQLLPSDDPNVSIVVLHGMAASLLDQNKPSVTAVAREARLRITNLPDKESAQIEISLTDAAGFDPAHSFAKAVGNVDRLVELNGQPLVVPSALKSKPKFLNGRTLAKLNKDPSLFPPVHEVLNKIEDALQYQEISRRLFNQWTSHSAGGATAMTFQQSVVGGLTNDEIRVFAPRARFDDTAPPDQSLTFLDKAGTPVRIERWAKGKKETTYTCDAVDVQLATDQLSRTGVGASFSLSGHVQREDHIRNINLPLGQTTISGLILSDEIKNVPDHNTDQLFDLAKISPSPAIKELNARALKNVQELLQKIDSELHSRGSFSLSCLTLVLFGAALGILLRGRNPLAVFVLGFVPAVLLVLLITAGRQLAEGSLMNVRAGIALIWAGNVVLLILVMAVYGKLLRH